MNSKTGPKKQTLRKGLVLCGLLFFATSGYTQKKRKSLAPKKTSNFFVQQSETDIEAITDESIAELQTLVDRFSDSKSRGELWLRLAELYVEKSKMEEEKAFRLFDQRLSAWERGKNGARPKTDLSYAQSFNKKAIVLYEKFIRYFPNDPRVDKALFFLGFNHYALGKVQKGTIFYRQLTQNHPQSPYISESNFALGEYHFDREEWSIARSYYQKISQDLSARLNLFSFYKMAWCDYRQGKYKLALKEMENVLYLSRKSRQEQNSVNDKRMNRLSLITEVINDLIPFYADSGRSYQEASDYMQRIAGPKVGMKLLEKLTYYYSDTGQKEAARYNFQTLIANAPLSAKAFDYQYQIVNNYVFSAKHSITEKELLLWVENYGPGSAWYQAQKGNKKLLKSANALRESTLRNYVLQNHETAKNSRQKFSQDVALSGYQMYLQFFPKTKYSAQMQFYYGDLLFDMKEYEKASVQLSEVIQKYPKSPYHNSALINLTLALEKSLPSYKALKKKLGKVRSKRPFSPELRRFEKSALLFLKKIPSGEKRLPVVFKLARLYDLHLHDENALRGYQEVVKKDPKSKMGDYSVGRILDIYNRKKDYKGLQNAGQKLLDSGISGKMSGDVKGVIEKSSFKTAQNLEKKGDFLKSAQSYEKFYSGNLSSPLAMPALFNAGVNFQRAGALLSSARVFEEFNENKSKKDKKQEFQALLSLPSLYIDLGLYRKAAENYGKLIQQYPKSPKKSEWAFNSAKIWSDLQVWNLSIHAYKEYFRTSRKKEREEAWFHIAEIYRKNRQTDQAISSYKKYLSFSPQSGEKMVLAHSSLSDLYRLQRKNKLALAEDQRLLRIGRVFEKKKIKHSKSKVAEAALRMSLISYKKFKAIKVPRGEKEQKKLLSLKLRNLESVKKEFAKVLKYKDPKQAVASMLYLGRSHWETYLYFKRIPIPKGLNSGERKEYVKRLDQQTKPFIEASRDYYRQGHEIAQKNQVYSKSSLAILKEIVNVQKSKNVYVEGKLFPSRKMGWRVL